MPPAQTFDGADAAFRVHGLVCHRYEAPSGDAVLDVELEDGTLLSVRDPEERYPPALVGESRTLSVAITGYQRVRPADREVTGLWTSDEGCAGVVGRRTAHCSWDGRRVAVPLDIAGTPVGVPLRQTTRPAREAGAADEVVADAGIDECAYVAVDDARLVVCDIDEDVDTDPYADTVHEDVAVRFDLNDERFRSKLAEGNRLAMVGFRVRLDGRWFLGDEERANAVDFLGIITQFAIATRTVLEGGSREIQCMDSPTRFRFEAVDDETMRLVHTDHRGKPLHFDFPPEGPRIDTQAFARALLEEIRELLRVAWEVGQVDLEEVEGIRQASIDLRHSLESRTDE
ncbi:hypothetical protein [Halobacterium zhouii]|uniref:hypothetical protein n=1 Tax=Halobacterium zhouii TaxID=2902624 RepID=UPI001E59FAEC|nr:hypothetical protein [Halobacterium zhouii]